jgi:hypothetical protein
LQNCVCLDADCLVYGKNMINVFWVPAPVGPVCQFLFLCFAYTSYEVRFTRI